MHEALLGKSADLFVRQSYRGEARPPTWKFGVQVQIVSFETSVSLSVMLEANSERTPLDRLN